MSESLGHELAGVCMADPALLAPPSTALAGRLPFRDLVADPFDPKCRAVIPAITTLTIRLRRYPAEPSFLLHWRDPAKVATAGGLYDVVPAGEFQPSSVALWDRRWPTSTHRTGPRGWRRCSSPRRGRGLRSSS